jgi:hypothetical protein
MSTRRKTIEKGYPRTTRKARAVPETARGRRPRKNTEKLFNRFALDFAAMRSELQARVGKGFAAQRADAVKRAKELVAARAAAVQITSRRRAMAAPVAATPQAEAAQLCLKALKARGGSATAVRALAVSAPVDPALPNWTPMGPLAIPNGQTYGGARVLISGRVTAIAPHPSAGDTIFIGTSRGGVWRTLDGADTWTALGDDQPSLAIGALAIGTDDPNVLYAGTGEGNVQLYSTIYPLSSAPGTYLGVGVLRSADGGNSWTHHAEALLAGHSFYAIAVDRNDANHAFAATSAGLCRTLDGTTWTALTGNGLPAINTTVIACTDVIVDRGDTTGNTVYAAFWRSGIYKSTNALAANPTFTLLTTGLPASSTMSRISLVQSASSPERKYALIASSGDAFLGLYRTTNTAGTDWELCTNSTMIQVYGAFTSDVNVDPTTPDVVYVSGVELYKCQHNAMTGTWSVSNVGQDIHPDSHCFAFHPTLNQTIYSGNDGGFYISQDGGATWDDSPNEGLCLLQYEAIDTHGTSDAIVQGGVQDNGTEQYRNSPVHYHSADGDGGYCTISNLNGNNITHTYYSNSPERSTAAGKFGSYVAISAGINGGGLFYPPMAISPTSERLALGTTVMNFDDAMGTGGWPGTGVTLPGISGAVSAVSFTNDNVVYCATTSGQVYRLDHGGGTWTARALHAAPLPTGQWIWDVTSVPGSLNTILVAFSGFGLAQHVWRGTVPASGTATWTAVSNGLPDVPMYALALGSAMQWFVGTDIGVFRSVDAGANWANFSQGLPNTAIYDLRLRDGSNLLRAATHGRGMWELRIDLASQPTVDLFVRDNIMDTGRPPTNAPVPAAWDDPTRYVLLNDTCWWWHCADIKTDAPPTWQLSPSEANYLNFETKLVHESPEKGNQNRVYVQVHNRGPLPASNVTVKIMTAGASGGLPPLPADFWGTWPNSAGDANWTPIGAPQTIATLPALRPEVLQWDWTPPASADTHSCMLVVIDSPSDPIPASTKSVFDIAELVTSEKRCGLKNLHLVNLLPDVPHPIPFHLYGSPSAKAFRLRIPPLRHPAVSFGMLLPKVLSKRFARRPPAGLRSARFTAKDLELLRKYWVKGELRKEADWKRYIGKFDTTRLYAIDPRSKGVELPVSIAPKSHRDVLLVVRTVKPTTAGSKAPAMLTLVQATTRGYVVGGSTFVFKPARQ